MWRNEIKSLSSFHTIDVRPAGQRDYGDVAKACNYGLAYGMGPEKLARSLGIAPEEARLLHASHRDTFEDVKRLIGTMMERAERNGPLRTFGGRIYYPDPDKCMRF